MALPLPPPEHVVRAWELHVEGRSLRTIIEILRRELGTKAAPGSPETVRKWVAQGRVAAAWLEENAASENYTGPEHVRAKFVDFLDQLISRGFDELQNNDQVTYKDIAPIMLRAAQEQARVVGAYAPTQLQVTGQVQGALDPHTAKIVQVMQEQAESRVQEIRRSGGTDG